jgi:hypothetical protein
MARREYPDPVVPRTFSSWAAKKSTTERATDARNGQTRRRTVDCWDVEGRADGVVGRPLIAGPGPGPGRRIRGRPPPSSRSPSARPVHGRRIDR